MFWRCCSSFRGSQCADAQHSMPVKNKLNDPNSERQLVDHCVAGDCAAWDRLYRQCHSPLLSSIRAIVGPLCDSNLVEEVEARVWYSLAADSARLLDRFEPERASLNTYLSTMARSEAGSYLRSEQRRHRREQVAARRAPAASESSLLELAQSIDEFVSTLSPREKEFCDEVLLSSSCQETEDGFSRANRWQLHHRVYRKLLQFLDEKQETRASR